MPKFFLILASIISFNIAQAQSFKVVKIQGKKAIVEVSDPTLISNGQTYDVGGTSVSHGKSSFKRDNGIELSAVISSFGTPSVTQISFDGTYLWNMKAYEFGPRVAFTSVTPGNSTTTSFGGKAYYNFNENKVGVEGVLSAEGDLLFTSRTGSSTTEIDLGANYRWFGLSGDHCISLSALYEMVSSSGSTASGFALVAGIATYF